MHASTVSQLVPWVIDHGYLLYFFVAVLEGPLVTMAAGVAAALGYYNIFIILLLAIGGDLGGDLIYYSFGYVITYLVKAKNLRFFGIKPERVEKIKSLLHGHTIKAILFIKMTPLIGAPGLIVLGSVRTPIRKFVRAVVMIGIPKSVFYALVGFAFANAYIYLDKAISIGQRAFLLIVPAALLLYLAYQRTRKWILSKLSGAKIE